MHGYRKEFVYAGMAMKSLSLFCCNCALKKGRWNQDEYSQQSCGHCNSRKIRALMTDLERPFQKGRFSEALEALKAGAIELKRFKHAKPVLNNLCGFLKLDMFPARSADSCI
jgi:hypothetical protein